ncbi:MAG: DUF2090 domain-containing protein [Actinomycetota bacterium]|nr:DUF2090 domain-containing protein [Actinomycetota bacterium]
MASGYDEKLYFLAFDHRESLQRKMLGIEGAPTAEQTETIRDAKRLRQLTRLGRLSDWLHERRQKLLFELLVPATEAQLTRVGGDSDRYDAELRPELMRRAVGQIQGAGIEVDVWKIEGVDERSDAEMLAEQTRAGADRERVRCVVLGRGASTERVEQWLRQAAPVEGFIGFAVGRSIWWDAREGYLGATLGRAQARDQIAENYLNFVRIYEHQEVR